VSNGRKDEVQNYIHANYD